MKREQVAAFDPRVFHHEGWLPGAIELDEEADAFLGDWYREVSPDGREHWPVVKALAVVPGASHGLLAERPELCNAIIGAFLR